MTDEQALEVAHEIIATLNPSPDHFMFGKIIPATKVDMLARAYVAQEARACKLEEVLEKLQHLRMHQRQAMRAAEQLQEIDRIVWAALAEGREK